MSDTTPQITPPKHASYGWKLAFGVSLAFNLAILGVMGGAMLKHGSPSHREAMVRDLGFGPFTEALTQQERATLRAAFLADNPGFRATRQMIRDDFTAFLAALRADPVDLAALRVVMDRQFARNSERLASGQALIFEHLAAMTPAARMAFADRLEASLSRRHDRKSAP